ncbi:MULTISPECIES: AAA family ATPase [unclassified Duganella]|uniref:AAA family ATPase n=1 Tax=unclassified Duganella TaxID=2636909 RepID=UPI00087EF39C|nr:MULTISPECIES: AAA family ATPase [unclassified Duganella]SDH07048.1 Primase C terminal 2 (PriCT-2) [Duganella sp. OV458]SDK19089.1 Primase C terminal 2 (PriCT-2) [Duganella sp. OV510]
MSADILSVVHDGAVCIGGGANGAAKRHGMGVTPTITSTTELNRIMTASYPGDAVAIMGAVSRGMSVPASGTALSPAHHGALQMASKGIPVFPVWGANSNGHCHCPKADQCTHPGKHPRYSGWMEAATADFNTINEWFQKDPTLNYGVRLGREVGNTGKMLMVVDVDSYKVGGAEALEMLEAIHGRLPETAEVVSGAGGRHCYYWAGSSLSFVGSMGENIDLKVNGYVVGPGSRHANGGLYGWEGSSNPFEGQEIADAPQWLIDKFSKAKRDEPNVENVTNDELQEHEVASIKNDLSYISAACRRAEWLEILMALHARDQSLSMFKIADEWSQTCPEKYDAAALVKAWNSFKPTGGITYETVRRIALDARIKDVDISKIMEKAMSNPAAAPITCSSAEQGDHPVTQPTRRYKLLSANDLANAPPLQWMIRGLFPQTGLVALYGPSGSGKSFLALDLAAMVAGGGDEWYGMRVKNGPVTYCVLEGEGGMGKRAKAWAQHHGKPLPDNLRFITQPINMLHSNDIEDLADAIIEASGVGGLTILDTLNRAAPEADENSSKDMGGIIAAAKRLQSLTGGLVMLVHHTGKEAVKGMRGHSSLFAAMDAVIGVMPSQAGPSWVIQKCKDDATGTAYKFSLEALVVGVDDEDDEISSCVAVPVGPAFAVRQSKKLGPHQVVAMATLEAIFCGSEGAVLYDEAIAAVAAKLDVDNKHKRERAKAAIGGLVDKGKIKIDSNYVRPA